MRSLIFLATAATAMACGGAPQAADHAPVAAVATDSSVALKARADSARPNAPSPAASAASASPAATAPAPAKTNAAGSQELRDSVIKPSMLIDEKTGAVTPIKKKPN